jgi:hypothetical protein
MSFEAAIRFASVLLILISQHRTELYEDVKAVGGQLADWVQEAAGFFKEAGFVDVAVQRGGTIVGAKPR